MHLDEEQLQRHLDGELLPDAARVVAAHLAGCADCRGRVAAARGEEAEVRALLQLLDAAPTLPAPDAESIVARADARRADVPAWAGRAAAVLVVLALAGAGYAWPGSPLRGWVDAVIVSLRGDTSPRPGAPVPPIAPDEEIGGGAGVAVEPGENLVIAFRAVQSAGYATVTLGDGHEVSVRAPGGAATFSSAEDRLVVDNRGSAASFDIAIPRDAPRVEILLGGRRIFLKEGARVSGGAGLSVPGPHRLPLFATAP